MKSLGGVLRGAWDELVKSLGEKLCLELVKASACEEFEKSL